MDSTEAGPPLTAEDLARVQLTIDAGTVWATVDGGRFAMRLIDAKQCQLAPGVLGMWLREDDLYEPIYSKDVLNQRVEQVIREFPVSVAKRTETENELRFRLEHFDDLVRLETERQLTFALSPWSRRKRDMVYLEKLNALRASAGLMALTLDEIQRKHE